MKRVDFFRMGLAVLFVLGGLAMEVKAQQSVDQQALSRADAIAHIAKLYPNSEKSPEQLYDEGQAMRVVLEFSHRFKYRDFDTLMGSVAQDSTEAIASQQLNPPIEPQKRIGLAPPTGANPETWVAPDEPAYHDSSYAQERTSARITQKVEKSKYGVQSRLAEVALDQPLLSSAAKDYSEIERRDMKRGYFEAMRRLPPDVRIALYPKKVTVEGQTATVEAAYGFEILGKPTIRSQAFVGHPAQPILLHMRRDGDDWIVANLKGILQQVAQGIQN